MEMLYRCMKCGTHVTPKADEYPECNICTVETILVLVTEKNKNSLPRPTDPLGMHEIDFNDPSKNCRCAPGICPCGKFVAHLASEAWDPENPHLFGSEYEEWNKNKEENA
jgi:DNA-directed RNA polymerase subunit RPC12/RpoP